MSQGDRKIADDVLRILHGARGLPPTEAIEALRPFLNEMSSRPPGSDRFGDASAIAVSALVHGLETEGTASDDIWLVAIESTFSLANAAD